jgi:hypothetical protein
MAHRCGVPAGRRGSHSVAAALLTAAGADPDDETRNGAPLICAASHGETAVVKALLAAGAHVDLTDNPPDTALRRVVAAHSIGHDAPTVLVGRDREAYAGNRAIVTIRWVETSSRGC